MNIKLKTAITCLLCFSLCACQDTATPGDEGLAVPVPIGFSADIAPREETQTRGNAITDIDYMYVFASYTGTSDWTSTDIPNYMYRQLMEKTEASAWTYSPVKYWPANAGEKLSFFAYAPITVSGIELSALGTAGPKITYTLPAKESDKQDLLVGSRLNKKQADAAVAFSMQHALTQVKFNVKTTLSLETTGSTVILNKLEVLAPAKGTLSFNATADNSFTWNCEATRTTFTAAINDEASGKVMNGNSTVAGTFFLFPVADLATAAVNPTLKLTYTLVKAPGTGSNIGTVSITSTLDLDKANWKHGNSLLYNLTIIDDRLILEGVTVKDFPVNGDSAAGSGIPAT